MSEEIVCPGCSLAMPHRDAAGYHGYYNASPECWLVYTEVLANEYSNAVLFGQVHQLTVDSYAVQHAGGPHPDKSVDIHLCGLHLVLVEGMKPVTVPPVLQRIASAVDGWPHFVPPPQIASITVFDVALAKTMSDHIEIVKRWARLIWDAWAKHHTAVAELARVR
ncbi:MAG TPA: DUF5946 family protein [Thermoanaerobaculia bacterium]